MEEEQQRAAQSNWQGSLPPGEIVAGKYRIESILGVGGMGTVYRVTNIFFEKQFALKVLDLKGAPNAVLVKRFQNEAKAAFSLNHANLVKVHDFGILESGDPYLVMDLVVGETLADLIKRKTVLTSEEYLPILEQVCKALSYAHSQSVIHRDVKPANIMISSSPGQTVKILDFGIAKIVNEEGGQVQELTRTGEIFGSPLYMSPEQCSGGVIDQRTDIYSLGCVTYEALTGAPPHVGANALRTMMLHQSTEVVPMSEASMGLKFSPQWEHVVARMLAKEASQRYSDAREIIAELRPGADVQSSISKRGVSPEKEKNVKTLSLSASQLGSMILGTMVATSICTFFVMQRVSEKQGSSSSDQSSPVQTAAAPADVEQKPAQKFSLSSIGTVDSKVVIGPDGKPERVIHCPAVEIGRIRVLDEYYDINGDELVAMGDVHVQAGVKLSFGLDHSFNDLTISHPEIINCIDPNIFDNLSIASNSAGINLNEAAESAKKLDAFDLSNQKTSAASNSDVVPGSSNDPSAPFSLKGPALYEGLEKCLENVQRWKKLKSLTFEYTTVTDGMVRAIAHLKGLECIRLIDNESISPDFASLPNLVDLRIMTFKHYNPTFLWTNPQNFKDLEVLSVDCEVTPTVLASLKRLPHLQRLNLLRHQFRPSPDLVEWLATTKKLSAVNIRHAVMTSSDVQKILANSAIKTLRLPSGLQERLAGAGVVAPGRLQFSRAVGDD